MTQNLYKLLLNQEIVKILIGDTTFEQILIHNYNALNISMPYLKGAELCEISSRFGLPKVYSWGESNQSRKELMNELLNYCMSKNKCSLLLAYLFRKEAFADLLKDCSIDEIDKTYAYITERIIEEINRILYFGGNQLTIFNKQYVIKPISQNLQIDAPSIKQINREYIKSISERALEDIEKGSYDSAITKSRTLLEEVFCYVIERKGQEPSTSGQIQDLYKQVKNLYNMHTDKDADKRVNTLLSGLEKIVSGISEMRNKDSDSHGVGQKRINIKDYHARLLVNSAMTMADFILSVEKNANNSNF